MAKIYSVCVGHFSKAAEANREVKKINEQGLKGYIFAIEKGYTIKVLTIPDINKANNAVRNLIQLGFEAFVC